MDSKNLEITEESLIALYNKGETADDIKRFLKAMQEKMIEVPVKQPVLDIVGTGGDNAHTVNISTGSALLAATMGVKVAKHGNRASSSQSGSADVLEALGVPFEKDPKKIAQSLENFGIAFLYAPHFHPAMKEYAPIRKKIPHRTIFNLLGPLLNPARPDVIMLGVCDPKLLEVMSEALESKRSLVFCGKGLDELSTLGPCDVIENGKRYVLDPQDYGFPRSRLLDLQGGDARFNSELLREVLGGREGPIADTLIFNAGVAFYLFGLGTIEEGIAYAKQKQHSGAGLELLDRWIQNG